MINKIDSVYFLKELLCPAQCSIDDFGKDSPNWYSCDFCSHTFDRNVDIPVRLDTSEVICSACELKMINTMQCGAV